jgi:CO/xanthine dehydrogenase FAD-binding subunit
MNNLKRCIELVAGLKTDGSLDADFVALAGAANEELERLHDELLQMTHNVVGAEAELERLQRIERAAMKLIALRGVAHGAWVIEELEAALTGEAGK